MPDVTIDEKTHDKLQFTANLMNRSIGDVIRLLVERLDKPLPPVEATNRPGTSSRGTSPAAPDATNSGPGWIPVHRTYKNERFEGEFNPQTMELRVTSAPWRGNVFSSPTAAAQAVVEHVPGDRQTNSTNGRKFWRVTATGQDLRSVVGERF
jgi:hypothetical protein